MNNGWIDTFARVNWNNVDGKFGVNSMSLGETPSVNQIDDLRFVTANINEPKVYHSEFEMMTRYISNYVYYRGVHEMYYFWDENRDAAVSQIEANLDTSDELKQCLRYNYLTNITFDWTERSLRLIHDASLRPRNTWITEDEFWNFDGTPLGYQSSDPTFEGICIVAKDLYGWYTKSCHVTQTVNYSKPANETYLFVCQNDVVINGNTVAVNTPLRVTSNELVIEPLNDLEAVIVVKEKI